MSSLTITRPEYSPEAAALVPGTRVGSYKVLRELGRGGMATVYEAVHEQIEQRAAIKVLSQAFSQDAIMCTRFLNEARAVNIVRHPGLVSIFEFGALPDGAAFIVMEYLEGESLATRLQRSGRLPVPEVLRLGRQIASALSAAHDKGIVHRDLKPGNVMIVADPDTAGGERAKVLDFGIAKVAASPGDEQAPARQSHPMTATGALMGTPCYMSPEQCRGEEVSDRSDVYALGVILFEMLSGQVPFDGPQPFEIMAKHLFRPTPTLRQVKAQGVPPDLSVLVSRMMAKKAPDRPTMAQVAQLLGPGDVSALPTLVRGDLRVARSRGPIRPLAAAGFGVVALLVLGAAGVAHRYWRAPAIPMTPVIAAKPVTPAKPVSPSPEILKAAPAPAVSNEVETEARPGRRKERRRGAQRAAEVPRRAPEAEVRQGPPERPVYRGTRAAIDTDFPLPAPKE